MLIHWIWLSTRPGLGDHGRMALLSRFQSAEQIYFAAKNEYTQEDDLSAEVLESLSDKDLSGSQKILDQCVNGRINILTIQDAAYPSRLKNIPDPPVVLYYKGQLPDFDSLPLIGVVGTRKASLYGLTAAKRLGYQVAACGGVVVSGMAYGIDGMAMSGALTAGMPVVGVLGCGADIVYPPSNKGLFSDTERYGCILTEFPPGTPPIGRNFPRRNRIISGLSCGVLVVEAPVGSGALITARHAADQGRDVFVVPGNIDVDSGEGSNSLLRDGAIAVTSGWDVMSEYEHLFPGKIRQNRKKTGLKAYPDELAEPAGPEERTSLKVAQKRKKPVKTGAEIESPGKKVIDNGKDAPYIDLNKTETPLTDHERTIVDQLRAGEKLVDDVIAGSGLSAGVVLASLTLLEVKGVVRRLPGRFVVLAGKK